MNHPYVPAVELIARSDLVSFFGAHMSVHVTPLTNAAVAAAVFPPPPSLALCRMHHQGNRNG